MRKDHTPPVGNLCSATNHVALTITLCKQTDQRAEIKDVQISSVFFAVPVGGVRADLKLHACGLNFREYKGRNHSDISCYSEKGKKI